MNSGKSDTLIKTAYNYEERGLRTLVLKPSADTKGGKDIVARAGSRRKTDIIVLPTTNLKTDISKFNNIHCVLVDESQFLSPEQVSQLYHVAKSNNISVICYGLRTDFLNTIFPGSKRLFEVADNIEKLPTMCSCGSQAEFNTRKVGDRYIFGGDQIAIDGEGAISYDSLCGACYIKEGGTI